MTRSKITWAAVITTALTLTTIAEASELYLSPRAAANRAATVARKAADIDLAHPTPGKVLLSPKAASLQPTTIANTASKDVDLAHPKGLTLSGSSHVREMQARSLKALGIEKFELAPLK